MKKVFISTMIIMFGLALAACIGPQKTAGLNDGAAPIGTQVIIVKTEMNADDAYRHAAHLAQDHGYSIRSSDSELGSISTDFNGVSKRWGSDYVFVRLDISIRGENNADIIIKGWYRTLEDAYDSAGQRVDKTGQSGSPVRDAWVALFRFASEIEGDMVFEQ